MIHVAEQLSLFGGERLRDAGIARVSANNDSWMESALDKIEKLDFDEATGEDFRMLLRIPEPRHPNAWGALTRTALSRGLITATGQWVKMKDPRSHARMTPVYRKCR